MSADNPTPRFAPRPYDSAKPLAKILTVPPGPPIDGVILSQSTVGVWTHWFQGRTHPCTARTLPDGSIGGCHLPHDETSSKWQGWVAVYLTQKRRIAFTAITEAAWRDCPQLDAGQGHLRGMTARFWRHGLNKNSRLSLTIGIQLTNDTALPPEPDTMVFLTNLWGRMVWFSRRQDNPDQTDLPAKKGVQ